jgi:acyl-CoA thioester hydrolase
MSPIYEQTFSVRYYECDMYGHVNHANYLRYMQEAALDASAVAGYDVAAYQALGKHWLMRESDIEYLAPLRYGDSVRVKTWLADFPHGRGEGTLRRSFELWRLPARGGPEEMAARGGSDWVFLASASGRPATVPPELVAAFAPEGMVQVEPPREPFPDVSPPAGAYTMRRRVAWHEVDPAQQVNSASYVAYAEDCAVQTAAAYGWPVRRMIEEGGFAIIARRYRIEYRQPALLDDELSVSTWVSEVKRATAVRHYRIERAGDRELLARAYALWVWTDVRTGKPLRIPSEFLADFAPNIAT